MKAMQSPPPNSSGCSTPCRKRLTSRPPSGPTGSPEAANRITSYNVCYTQLLRWLSLFLFMGNFFGNIPFVKANFEFVIIAIILMSVLPMLVEYLKARNEKKTKASDPTG